MVQPKAGLLHLLVDDLTCPVIQYADDILILIRAEHDQVCRLKLVLDSFAATAGLNINYHKDTFIPLHVADDQAAELATMFAYPVADLPQTHLGLPLFTEKLSVATLDSLVVKVVHVIPRWHTSLLSKGGCLTLVEVVLTAQAIYAMFAILVPPHHAEPSRPPSKRPVLGRYLQMQ